MSQPKTFPHHRPVRIGIIGTGEVTTNRHLPALGQIPDGVLWSILSHDPKRAAEIAERFNAKGKTPAHTSLTKMLHDPELDAVIIATPDKEHAKAACLVAKAGKHILVEKPMALTVEDAHEIQRTSEQVRLAVGYHLRFHEGHRKLRDAIRSGAIGKPLYLQLAWSYKAPEFDWRKDPVQNRWWALAAIGTHAIDLASYLFESEGEIVHIDGHQEARKGQNEHAADIMIRFKSGATAKLLVDNTTPRTRWIQIRGSEGEAFVEDTLGAHGGGRIAINGYDLPFSLIDPYEAQLRDFICSIRTGKEPEVNSTIGEKNVLALHQFSANAEYIYS